MSRDDPMRGFDTAFSAPVRLQISAVLNKVDEAEFARLREIANVADSVLSKHLSALSEAGYVQLRKAAMDGRQRTWVRMSSKGRAAFTNHVAALRRLAAGDNS